MSSRKPFFMLCLSTVITITGTSAVATPLLVCEQDKRPADGAYTKIQVIQTQGKLSNIYYTSLSSEGFGPPNTTNNFKDKLMAKNVACSITKKPAVSLACYDQGNPVPVVSIQQVKIATTTFTELKMNGDSVALLDPSSCK